MRTRLQNLQPRRVGTARCAIPVAERGGRRRSEQPGPCVSAGAFRLLERGRGYRSTMSLPLTTRENPTLLSTASPRLKESQRDSIAKPRVARHELPWVNAVKFLTTLKGLYRFQCPVTTGAQSYLRFAEQ